MGNALLTRADLLNPAKFVTVPSVPVFRPHARTVRLPGHEKPVSIAVQDSDVLEIVANCKRLDGSGVFFRLTDGHTQFATPNESGQPPLIGFASNPHLKTLNGVPHVAYDWHVKPEHARLLKERPYRSAEYYPATKQIRGVALLLRDPALDMGTLYYDRGGELVYLYGVNEMDDDSKTTAGQTALVEAVISAILERFPGLAAMAGGGQTTPPNDSPMPPVPANLNSVPALYEQRTALLQEQVKKLTEARNHEVCVQMVSSLIAERFQLDPSVEIEFLKALPEERRKDRLDYVRKYYQQLPGGSPIPVLPGRVDYGNTTHLAHYGNLTREQAQKASDLSIRKGIDIEEAKRLVLEGKA